MSFTYIVDINLNLLNRVKNVGMIDHNIELNFNLSNHPVLTGWGGLLM